MTLRPDDCLVRLIRHITCIVGHCQLLLHGHVARYTEAEHTHRVVSVREISEWRRSRGRRHGSWRADRYILPKGTQAVKGTCTESCPENFPDLVSWGGRGDAYPDVWPSWLIITIIVIMIIFIPLLNIISTISIIIVIAILGGNRMKKTYGLPNIFY